MASFCSNHAPFSLVQGAEIPVADLAETDTVEMLSYYIHEFAYVCAVFAGENDV